MKFLWMSNWTFRTADLRYTVQTLKFYIDSCWSWGLYFLVLQPAIFLQVSNIFPRCCLFLARRSGAPGSASGPSDALLRGLRDSEGGWRACVLFLETLGFFQECWPSPHQASDVSIAPVRLTGAHAHTHSVLPSTRAGIHAFPLDPRHGRGLRSQAKGLPSPGLWQGGTSPPGRPLSSSFALCSPPAPPDSPQPHLIGERNTLQRGC